MHAHLHSPEGARLQEDFVREYEASMLACRATGDFYGNEFATITNLFYQLNSIRLVTALWRDSRRVYDAVVYLRPDLLYNCRFPVAQLQDLAPNTWYVADNHHFEGLNDRFVMARPSEAALWGDRLYFTFATCSRMQVRDRGACMMLAHQLASSLGRGPCARAHPMCPLCVLCIPVPPLNLPGLLVRVMRRTTERMHVLLRRVILSILSIRAVCVDSLGVAGPAPRAAPPPACRATALLVLPPARDGRTRIARLRRPGLHRAVRRRNVRALPAPRGGPCRTGGARRLGQSG